MANSRPSLKEIYEERKKNEKGSSTSRSTDSAGTRNPWASRKERHTSQPPTTGKTHSSNPFSLREQYQMANTVGQRNTVIKKMLDEWRKMPPIEPLLLPGARGTWKDRDNSSLVAWRNWKGLSDFKTQPRFGPSQVVCRLCGEVLGIPPRTRKIPVLDKCECEEVKGNERVRRVCKIFGGKVSAVAYGDEEQADPCEGAVLDRKGADPVAASA